MSVNEETTTSYHHHHHRTRMESSSPPTMGITRSKSFTGGILSHKRSASLASNGSSSICGSGTHRSDTILRAPWTPILGQNHRGSSGSLRSLGMSLAKIPKNPRPARTNIIFDAIAKGLNECVAVTEEDINSLKGSVEGLSVNSQQSQGKLYELEKQLKVAERYLKRLEYQLTKLEELQDHYILQQKLKDGVRNMAHAYILSPGRERENALSNVRSGFKECLESLCCVEAQLEQMMGTFQLKMNGVQGFARLCAGDAFEISVRHGHQKWKTRGRVLKNKLQTWDNQGIIFKAFLSEVLHIKAVEVKGLTKTVLLGNKYCDTKDLFCANPQIMTVNLNSSGSLKLSIIITWNPLDGTREDLLRSQLQTKGSASPQLKERTLMSSKSLSHCSLASQTLQHGYYDGGSSNGDGQYSPDVDSRSMSSSHSSASARSSAISTPDTDFRGVVDHLNFHDATTSNGQLSRPTTAIGRLPQKSTSLDSMYLQTNINVNSVQHRSREMEMSVVKEHPSLPSPLHKADSLGCCSMDLGSSSQGSHLDGGPSLPEMVNTLASSLEDIQGQYPELYGLEVQVLELELLVRNGGRRGSHSSDISSSIESALECFDFLNTEVDEDDGDYIEDKLIEDEKSLDPELTAKTSDSGIASIARKLRGLNSGSPDSGPSPLPPTTGNEQLDLSLCSHLNHCLRLLENLGAFGPLKRREIKALEKLKVQTLVIERLLKLAKYVKEDKGFSVTGTDELREDVLLQQLWNYIADNKGIPICVNAEQCYHRLVTKCEQRLQWKHSSNVSHLAAKVARLIMLRILDSNRFDPDAIVSVHQFSDYFWRNCSSTLEKHIDELAEEMILLDVLRSSNVDAVVDALERQTELSGLPSVDCLRSIVALMVSGNRQLQQSATAYILGVGNDSSLRGRVLGTLVEGLESDDFVIRQASCTALACLEANEFIEQLAYIFQADENAVVRSSAKLALLSFGSEGQQAFEQGQLSSFGFQGLRIH